MQCKAAFTHVGTGTVLPAAAGIIDCSRIRAGPTSRINCSTRQTYMANINKELFFTDIKHIFVLVKQHERVGLHMCCTLVSVTYMHVSLHST